MQPAGVGYEEPIAQQMQFANLRMAYVAGARRPITDTSASPYGAETFAPCPEFVDDRVETRLHRLVKRCGVNLNWHGIEGMDSDYGPFDSSKASGRPTPLGERDTHDLNL